VLSDEAVIGIACAVISIIVIVTLTVVVMAKRRRMAERVWFIAHKFIIRFYHIFHYRLLLAQTLSISAPFSIAYVFQVLCWSHSRTRMR
jgi:hypothetical protein